MQPGGIAFKAYPEVCIASRLYNKMAELTRPVVSEVDPRIYQIGRNLRDRDTNNDIQNIIKYSKLTKF